MPFTADNTRRINLGFGGTWLDRSIKENVITYGVARRAWRLYEAGDRDGLIDWYMGQTSPYTDELVTRAVAGRYANELHLFCMADENMLWLTTGTQRLFWCQTEPPAAFPDIVEEYVETNPNGLADRRSYLLARPVHGRWRDATLGGAPIDLLKMHPKARDWLTQRGTMGKLKKAQYFIDLIEGRSLEEWHALSEMSDAAAERGWYRGVPRVPDDWRRAIAHLADSILHTVASSNGQTVERTVKNKTTSLDKGLLEVLMRELVIEQNYRCALTGRRMVVGDPWLKPSPDRIDSDRGYERENLQMTTWAANRAKGALEPERVAGFFLALQMPWDGTGAEPDDGDGEEA